MADRVLRLLVVPGTNPGRWVATWRERVPVPLELVAVEAAEQATVLAAGGADLGLVRTPLPGDTFSAIPLYDEIAVVVLPKDHPLAEETGVTAADLAEEHLLVPADDVLGWADPPVPVNDALTPATTAAAVELVAAGTGVLVVPMSLARLHHRRDVTAVPVTDAPTSGIALAWVTERGDELTEEFVGIVRGRTVNSSRGLGKTGPDAAGTPRKETPSRSSGGGRQARRGSAPRRSGPPRPRRKGR